MSWRPSGRNLTKYNFDHSCSSPPNCVATGYAASQDTRQWASSAPASAANEARASESCHCLKQFLPETERFGRSARNFSIRRVQQMDNLVPRTCKTFESGRSQWTGQTERGCHWCRRHVALAPAGFEKQRQNSRKHPCETPSQNHVS